jgi:hypothetical protein
MLADRLERREIDLFARRLLPTPDPSYAKVTVRVIDKKRLPSRGDAMSQMIRATNLRRPLVWPGFPHNYILRVFRLLYVIVAIRVEPKVVVYCAAKICLRELQLRTSYATDLPAGRGKKGRSRSSDR